MVEERVKDADLSKTTPQDQQRWFSEHLAQQATAFSTTIEQKADKANFMRDTLDILVRKMDQWTFPCHRCKKKAAKDHLASAAHRAHV